MSAKHIVWRVNNFVTYPHRSRDSTHTHGVMLYTIRCRLSKLAVVTAMLTTGLFSLAIPASAGETWSWSTLDTHQIVAISCVSSSFCIVADNDGRVFTYTGSWSAAVDIDGTDALKSVSCVSSTFCMAVDANGDAFAYNGTNWTTLTIWSNPMDSTNSINGVSCVTTSYCMAVDGNGNAFAYNGTDWTTLTTWTNPIDGAHPISYVSCVSSSFCVAVDESGDSLSFTGAWSAALDFDGSNNVFSVSCVSSTFCMSVDSHGDAFTYNGTNWTTLTTWTNPIDLASNAIESVSCNSTSYCMATDAKGNYMVYTGTWTAPVLIDVTKTIWAVSCVASSFCIAGNTNGLIFSYPVYTVAATVVLTGTTLGFAVAPPNITFPAVVLTAYDQTQATTEPLNVVDATGTGTGWNLTITSTTYTNGAHPVLSMAEDIYSVPTVSCDSGATCSPAVCSVTYCPSAYVPISVPEAATAPTAIEFYDATAHSGLGAQTVSVPLNLDVPGGAFQGTYTSTWTFTLVSGP